MPRPGDKRFVITVRHISFVLSFNFMGFSPSNISVDIVNYYPSISEELLVKAIEWSKTLKKILKQVLTYS